MKLIITLLFSQSESAAHFLAHHFTKPSYSVHTSLTFHFINIGIVSLLSPHTPRFRFIRQSWYHCSVSVRDTTHIEQVMRLFNTFSNNFKLTE